MDKALNADINAALFEVARLCKFYGYSRSKVPTGVFNDAILLGVTGRWSNNGFAKPIPTKEEVGCVELVRTTLTNKNNPYFIYQEDLERGNYMAPTRLADDAMKKLWMTGHSKMDSLYTVFDVASSKGWFCNFSLEKMAGLSYSYSLHSDYGNLMLCIEERSYTWAIIARGFEDGKWKDILTPLVHPTLWMGWKNNKSSFKEELAQYLSASVDYFVKAKASKMTK